MALTKVVIEKLWDGYTTIGDILVGLILENNEQIIVLSKLMAIFLL